MPTLPVGCQDVISMDYLVVPIGVQDETFRPEWVDSTGTLLRPTSCGGRLALSWAGSSRVRAMNCSSAPLRLVHW